MKIIDPLKYYFQNVDARPMRLDKTKKAAAAAGSDIVIISAQG